MAARTTTGEIILTPPERARILAAIHHASEAIERLGEAVQLLAPAAAHDADREARELAVDDPPDTPTRAQELAADAMAAKYGRSGVRRLADGAAVISGLIDDVEMELVCIEIDGRERWRK